MNFKIKIKENVYNQYGNMDAKVIINLKEKPNGMSLTEIKESCYTLILQHQGATKSVLDTTWRLSLESLVEHGLITIENDIVKLNQEKYNEIEFFE